MAVPRGRTSQTGGERADDVAGRLAGQHEATGTDTHPGMLTKVGQRGPAMLRLTPSTTKVGSGRRRPASARWQALAKAAVHEGLPDTLQIIRMDKRHTNT